MCHSKVDPYANSWASLSEPHIGRDLRCLSGWCLSGVCLAFDHISKWKIVMLHCPPACCTTPRTGHQASYKLRSLVEGTFNIQYNTSSE